MHRQVAPCAIFFVTAFVMAGEFVDTRVSLRVVSQNPFLAKLAVATWKCAGILLSAFFIMRAQMVGHVILRLERLGAAGKCAFMSSQIQMGFEMRLESCET